MIVAFVAHPTLSRLKVAYMAGRPSVDIRQVVEELKQHSLYVVQPAHRGGESDGSLVINWRMRLQGQEHCWYNLMCCSRKTRDIVIDKHTD